MFTNQNRSERVRRQRTESQTKQKGLLALV
nr:MAG TPA: hypothetical protein [Caudoviricetes sp.]